MHKPDDILAIDCTLDFNTAVLLSCSIHSCMYLACVFECFFIFDLQHTFWTKIYRIYKHGFSSVFKETFPILDSPTSTGNTLKRQGKNFHQFVQKMVEKKKIEKTGVVKPCVLKVHTNADLEICQYLRLHMKMICRWFYIKTPFTFWDMRTWHVLKVCLQTFRNNRIC